MSRNASKVLCAVVWLGLGIVLMPPAAHAGLFETADAAYKNGDFTTAVKLLQPVAEKGNPRAQYNLGVMYANAKGVERNLSVAVEWFQRAADQGYAPAQAALGIMYANGLGLPQELVRAHMWLELAAAQQLESAVRIRDVIVHRMTPAQIADAQRMARRWKPSRNATLR